jgi:NAD-dependent dihydropyrimidine dehydrogenase PreA subunit
MDKKTGKKFIPTVDNAMCKGCGYCIEVCSKDVFEPSSDLNAQGCHFVAVAHECNCTGCLQCFAICPDFAISINEISSE